VVSGEKLNQNADFENHKSQISERESKIESRRSKIEDRNSKIEIRKSPITNRQSPIARWPDEPMKKSPDAFGMLKKDAQEELTILLDAGRNICCLLWGAGMPILAKVGYNFRFCKKSCTRHFRLPVRAGVLQVSFASALTDHTAF
jgi:hypothetical protein